MAWRAGGTPLRPQTEPTAMKESVVVPDRQPLVIDSVGGPSRSPPWRDGPREGRCAPPRGAGADVTGAGLGVHTDERAWRLGAGGEEKVAAKLAGLVAQGDGRHVLHAIPVGRRGSDIDHLVVGPVGVSTLDARHHPGAKIVVSSDSVRVNGHRTSHVRNSRFEAQRAARLLSRPVGVEVPVTGVIVPVRASDVVVKRQPEGVRIVPRMRLVRWLSGLPATMEQATVDLLFDAARRSTTWVE